MTDNDKKEKKAIGSTALDRMLPKKKDAEIAKSNEVTEGLKGTENTQAPENIKNPESTQVTKDIKVKPLHKVNKVKPLKEKKSLSKDTENTKVKKVKPSSTRKNRKAKKTTKTGEKAKIVKNNEAEKVRFTVIISNDLLEALRDAVVATPGATLASAAEAALDAWLVKKAKDFPRGKIPSRGTLTVKQGRPIR